MSTQSDAETVRDLADKIARFEQAKTLANSAGATVVLDTIKITNTAGTVLIFDVSEMAIAVTGSQKTAAFAQESTWETTIKNITSAWTP